MVVANKDMHDLVYKVKLQIENARVEGGIPSKIRMHPLDIQVLQWQLVEGVKPGDIYGGTLLEVLLEPDCAVARDNPQVDSLQ